MTPEQREELKWNAENASQHGEHIYTNPRDSNLWKENAVWQVAASPEAVLSLIAQVEALTVPQGWKLVPVELTDDMLIAFAEVWYSKARAIDDCEMADCYAAMLDAAPIIPAIPKTKEDA